MSHERTVAQFVAEIEHLTGRRLVVRWMPFRGLYLQDKETGNIFGLGEGSRWRVLTSLEQQAICDGLSLTEVPDLLGLDPAQGD